METNSLIYINFVLVFLHDYMSVYVYDCMVANSLMHTCILYRVYASMSESLVVSILIICFINCVLSCSTHYEIWPDARIIKKKKSYSRFT